MVFVLDEGGVFDAPLDRVWEFVSSGDAHSRAHRHRRVRRVRRAGTGGRYSWEQDFLGRPETFTMEWRSYWPVGVAYEVTGGPFEGSRFFLFYIPRGRRTGVTIAGEFVSPRWPDRKVRSAVRAFFSREFAQDSRAISAMARKGRRRDRR